jgi:hypothetical protein
LKASVDPVLPPGAFGPLASGGPSVRASDAPSSQRAEVEGTGMAIGLDFVLIVVGLILEEHRAPRL